LNRRETGTRYEKRAADYLRERGVRILEQNYRTRYGEIDLVGMDGAYLVFFEVKYRSNDRLGYPLEAVNPRKQKTIMNTARAYLRERGVAPGTPVRFDCVGILGGETEWVKNAFQAR